ncbi:MAG: cytochrome C oxidase subunit IV family protein [Proteobacteria bacterium]|nr:cytochrome C oxidase subunit IV family protein [Pseudomonadota bacterium]
MPGSEPSTRVSSTTWAWLALVAMTLLAWSLGVFGQASASDARLATLGVIATACMKVWLIARQFMDLRIAPPWLRYGFSAWIVAVGTLLALICVAPHGWPLPWNAP